MTSASENSPGDDAKARFRAALERKSARTGVGATPHDPGKSVTPSDNTKRQKTFRRKSGG